MFGKFFPYVPQKYQLDLGFKNILTLSAFDRVSYWTDKIILHINPFFLSTFFRGKELFTYDVSQRGGAG